MTPEDDALATMWGLVIEACFGVTRSIVGTLERELDLPGPWFEILLRLSRSPDGQLLLSELAREVSFSPGGLTKLVDRMEARGLVERRRHPSDRRMIFGAVTEHGLVVLGKAVALQSQILRERVIEPLGHPQVEHLADLMRTLRDAGRPQPAGAHPALKIVPEDVDAAHRHNV